MFTGRATKSMYMDFTTNNTYLMVSRNMPPLSLRPNTTIVGFPVTLHNKIGRVGQRILFYVNIFIVIFPE